MEKKPFEVKTSLPFGVDDQGNLTWIGGSEDNPWIVTTSTEIITDAKLVGGKSAKQARLFRNINAVGVEMPQDICDKIEQAKELGVKVENQFAVTIFAYEAFIAPHMSKLQVILDRDNLDPQKPETFDVAEQACQEIMNSTDFSTEMIEAITIAFQWLDYLNPDAMRAVRSTAPSEDGASFSGSGKYTTFLEVKGADDVIKKIKSCFVSRFNTAALSYQFDAPEAFGEDLASLTFAVMVQDMSKIISAGTMFSACTQSGHTGFIEINSNYGLGESVVSGKVSSDSWIFNKRTLSEGFDGLVEFKLGEKQEYYWAGKYHTTDPERRSSQSISNRNAVRITKIGILLSDVFRFLDKDSLQSDFEWALTGNKEIIITQQRAITTLSKKQDPVYETYELKGLKDGEESQELKSRLIMKNGINAGVLKIVRGVVIKLLGEGEEFVKNFGNEFGKELVRIKSKFGEDTPVILVTHMTYPWMERYMALCKACVTTRGGQNDHTPIWCKEHGLPAAVSVKKADKLPTDTWITYYGCDSVPYFYNERVEYSVSRLPLVGLKPSPIPIRLILSNPETARITCEKTYHPSLNIGMGSGLVRWEMIATALNVHPVAVLRLDNIEQDYLELVEQGRMTHDQALKEASDAKAYIEALSKGYESPVEWYIDSFSRYLAQIVSPYYTEDINEPMTIRTADFKTNEHTALKGGIAYEPVEENPALGDRGAGKYLNGYKGFYPEAFKIMDMEILKRLTVNMGYKNVRVEVPFVRSPHEQEKVRDMLIDYGIDAPIDMMFELPINISRAKHFFPFISGGQIGSNDLLSLETGSDRSGGEIKEDDITHLKFRIVKLNQRRRAYEDKINSDKANENKPKLKIKMGLCGNLPSQLPSFAQFLASERPEEDVAFGEFELRKGMGRVVDEFSVTTDALITSLLAITGEKPEGKVTVTTYCEDGSVLVNGELVVEAVEI